MPLFGRSKPGAAGGAPGTSAIEWMTWTQLKLTEAQSAVLSALPPGSERWITPQQIQTALAMAHATAPLPRREDLPVPAAEVLERTGGGLVSLPLPPLEDAGAWRKLREQVLATNGMLLQAARARAKLRATLQNDGVPWFPPRGP